MAETKGGWTDQDFAQVLGRLLQAGVIAAALLVFVGGAVYLFRHGGDRPDNQVFKGEPADLRTVSGIVRNALDFRGRSVIQLGLLLLIATPVARVIFSVYAFARERDWIYVMVTLLVLAVLLLSLIGGELLVSSD